MTTRFCPRCDAEVEDTGGYCLLGHPLRAVPLVPTIGELRGEPAPDTAGWLPPPVAGTEASPRHSEPRPVMATVGGAKAQSQASAEPSPAAGPEEAREQDALPAESARYGLWDTLFSTEPSRIVANDPIADFAADGRINWGPRRRFLPGRPFRRQLA